MTLTEAIKTLDEGPALDRMLEGVDEAWETVKKALREQGTVGTARDRVVSLYGKWRVAYREFDASSAEDFVLYLQDNL